MVFVLVQLVLSAMFLSSGSVVYYKKKKVVQWLFKVMTYPLVAKVKVDTTLKCFNSGACA